MYPAQERDCSDGELFCGCPASLSFHGSMTDAIPFHYSLNKDRCQRKKTGLCGKNSQTEGGGLTQTHFLMSTYQVIFGMPK